MKINSIRLGCKSTDDLKLNTHRPVFFLFRNPVNISVNGKNYECTESCAVVFSAGSRYEFVSASHTPARFDLIELRFDSADKQYLSAVGMPLDTPVIIRDDYVISGLMKCMKEQSVRSKTTSGDFMEHAVRTLFAAVCEEIQAEKVRSSPPETPHIAELRALRESIYEFPTNEWVASDCASDIGVSRAYFHRLYFAAFGVTFLHDSIESRLIYASELLEMTDLSVNAIAEKCGYESDSYFMRQFKKHRGCTPTEYRNSK